MGSKESGGERATLDDPRLRRRRRAGDRRVVRAGVRPDHGPEREHRTLALGVRPQPDAARDHRAGLGRRAAVGADLGESAPILCAGVTTFKGLRETEARPGEWVAISGVGGLGHAAFEGRAVPLTEPLLPEFQNMASQKAESPSSRGIGSQAGQFLLPTVTAPSVVSASLPWLPSSM